MDLDKPKAGPGLAALLKKRCCQIVSMGGGNSGKKGDNEVIYFLASILALFPDLLSPCKIFVYIRHLVQLGLKEKALS